MRQKQVARQLGEASRLVVSGTRRSRRAVVDYSSAAYDAEMDAALAAHNDEVS